MGVVAVNIIGDPMGAAVGAPGRSMGGVVADLALDMNVDAVTATKIRDVLVQKQAAVDREDYDECKRLKVEGDTRLHPDRPAPRHEIRIRTVAADARPRTALCDTSVFAFAAGSLRRGCLKRARSGRSPGACKSSAAC